MEGYTALKIEGQIINKSKLIIIDESFVTISSPIERPGLFRRFWYWLLLDCKWEKISTKDTDTKKG